MSEHPPKSIRERGATLVELAIVVAIIVIIVTIAVARLSRAKGTAEDGSAIGSLHAIFAAQVVARQSYGNFLPASDLVSRGLLDSTFHPMPVVRSGYRITETGSGETLAYSAEPLSLEFGARRFYMPAATGVIHYTDSGDPADATSPVLGSGS